MYQMDAVSPIHGDVLIANLDLWFGQVIVILPLPGLLVPSTSNCLYVLQTDKLSTTASNTSRVFASCRRGATTGYSLFNYSVASCPINRIICTLIARAGAKCMMSSIPAGRQLLSRSCACSVCFDLVLKTLRHMRSVLILKTTSCCVLSLILSFVTSPVHLVLSIPRYWYQGPGYLHHYSSHFAPETQ
jgi:hypothetical protein